MLAPAFATHKEEIPVLKTIASERQGMEELFEAINKHHETAVHAEHKAWLFAEKAWQLIQYRRMKDLDKEKLADQIRTEMAQGRFNLYSFTKKF